MTLPIGGYDFHTTRVGYIAGQQRRVSGELVFEMGSFYNGDRKSIAVNAGRMQVTPQLSLEPSMSINWVDLVQGSFSAKVARTRATYTITPRSQPRVRREVQPAVPALKHSQESQEI